MAAIKVYMLGDSHVAGNIYPKEISNILTKGNSNISFSYSGKNGACFDTYNNSSSLLQQALNYQPNILIVHLGTNDSYTAKFDAKTFTSNVTTFYNKVIQALPPCKIAFVTPFVNKLKNGETNSSTTKCADALVSFANSHNNCVVINNNKNHGNDFIEGAGLMQKDYVHLTGKGYKLLAEQVGQALLGISSLWNGVAISQSSSTSNSATSAGGTTDGSATTTYYVITYRAKTIKKKVGTEKVEVHENLRLVQGRWWAINEKGVKEDGLPWIMWIDKDKGVEEYKCMTEYGEIVYIKTSISNHFFGEAINVAYKDGADKLIDKIISFKNILDFMYKNGISAYKETWAKDGKVIDTVHFGTNTSKQAEFWNRVYATDPTLIERYPAYFEWNIHNRADPRKTIKNENEPPPPPPQPENTSTEGSALAGNGVAPNVNLSNIKGGEFAGKTAGQKKDLIGFGANNTPSVTTRKQLESNGTIVNHTFTFGEQSLTCPIHKGLINDLQSIFNDIKSKCPNFQIVKLSNTIRSDSHSRHNAGCAIDINAYENPWFKSGSNSGLCLTNCTLTPQEGETMKAFENRVHATGQYGSGSISNSSGSAGMGGTKYNPNRHTWSGTHTVVKIFLAHGWRWGGDYGDVMHYELWNSRG